MPAKNASLTNGPRFNPLSRRLWRDFLDINSIQEVDLPYELFREVIVSSNLGIKDKLIETTDGFKFPEELGYAVITRFKPRVENRRVNWAKTKATGVKVYHTNFHSFGYKPRIGWFTDRLSRCQYLNIYKFVPSRELVRTNSARIQEGKTYNEFTYKHFKERKININLNKIR